MEKFFVNSPLQRYFHHVFGLGKFLRKLLPHSYQNILEIGTGVGFTARLLAEKYPGASIVATDFDEDLLAIAKRKRQLRNVAFKQEDATKLSFPDKKFDAIFAILVLHHIEDFSSAIKEMSRVTKPGGSIYIMDIPSKSFNFVHLIKSAVPGLFVKTDIIYIMRKNGLEITDYGKHFLFTLEGKKKFT